MKRKFMDFIADGDPAGPPLPLMHTTRGAEFRQIAESNQLSADAKADDDPFPGEKLIYFFYGRPVFREEYRSSTWRQMLLPVALVLRPEAVKKIKRTYPFDSGAAHKNLYEPSLQKPLSWRDLEIGNSLEAAGRVVSQFFGTNKNYIIGTRREGLNIPVMNFEADAYYQLIADRDGRADDRRFTVEVQVEAEHGFGLSAENVLAVALPNIFMDDKDIRRIICDEWKAKPLTYSTFNGRVGECYKDIMNQVASFLDD